MPPYVGKHADAELPARPRNAFDNCIFELTLRCAYQLLLNTHSTDSLYTDHNIDMRHAIILTSTEINALMHTHARAHAHTHTHTHTHTARVLLAICVAYPQAAAHS